MTTNFEGEINAMSKFITVDDSTNIHHAESILRYFITAFKTHNPVFSTLYNGYSMAGTRNKINIPIYYLSFFYTTGSYADKIKVSEANEFDFLLNFKLPFFKEFSVGNAIVLKYEHLLIY